MIMETAPDKTNNIMHNDSVQNNSAKDNVVSDHSIRDNLIPECCIPEDSIQNSAISGSTESDRVVLGDAISGHGAQAGIRRDAPVSSDKLMSLSAAVGKFVKDGASVAMCTCYESLIPFAAGHEIIRQKKRGLTLICPISDILFDQIIGAGCANTVKAAWVGNVITGSGYNFRRAVEKGGLKVEDHSNFTISLALKAGSMGVPFMPSRTALGSDLFKTNSGIQRFNCPVTGEKLTAVKAINPDVAIVHLQRADRYGNAHMWGNTGITKEAAMAADNIIITAEEIVPSRVIRSDPGRVLFPGFMVSAVVHAPFGGHPSPVPGFYNRDHDFFLEYRNHTKTEELAGRWFDKWIDSVKDRNEYCTLIGEKRLDSLKILRHVESEIVDYGY